MDQLAAMRAFVRIVETGSFTHAAESLGAPKATVTKLIQLLETHLRTRLLSRTTRRLAVTVDGAAYYERTVRLLADLDELDGTVMASQARPRGRLRIDVSVPLAQDVIIPALAAFHALYPDIVLEIGVSDRRTDLVADNVDCVLRGGDLVDQSLVARRIAELHMVTCAAPAYLARHGMPEAPSDLDDSPGGDAPPGPTGGHLVVGYFNASTGRPRPFRFERNGERRELFGRAMVSVNEISTYVTAGLAGHGVVQLPWFLARDHLSTARLTPVLSGWHVPSVPLYVVYPPNRHLSNKLRVFVDWVAALFVGARFAAPATGDSPAAG